MALKTQKVHPAIIANGAALSDVIDLSLVEVVAIIIPAAWTAAALTFLVSPDGVTFTSAYDEAGNELTVASAAVVANHAIVLTTLALQAMISAAPFMQIRSGTSASPVNQAAARTLNLLLGG